MRRPLRSKRAITSRVSPRPKASGLTRISVLPGLCPLATAAGGRLRARYGRLFGRRAARRRGAAGGGLLPSAGRLRRARAGGRRRAGDRRLLCRRRAGCAARAPPLLGLRLAGLVLAARAGLPARVERAAAGDARLLEAPQAARAA